MKEASRSQLGPSVCGKLLRGEGACPQQRDPRIWFSHSLGLVREKEEDQGCTNSRADEDHGSQQLRQQTHRAGAVAASQVL